MPSISLRFTLLIEEDQWRMVAGPIVSSIVDRNAEFEHAKFEFAKIVDNHRHAVFRRCNAPFAETM